MWSRWRGAITALIVNSTIYASIALGIFPYGYNRRRRRIVSSKCCLVYCICVDCLIILLTLCVWPKEKLVSLERIYYWTLVELLSRFIIFVNLSALFVIMWNNWREYSCVMGIFNEFASIECTYFARYARLAKSCVKFDSYMILKGLSMLLKNLSFVYVVLVMFKDMSFSVAAVHTIAMLLVNIIALVVCHFYIFILVTYRYIWIMKQRIKAMAGCAAHSAVCGNLQREINEITGVYMRLVRVCQQFGRIYGKQMLLCITGVASLNVLTLVILLFVWRSIVDTLNIIYCWYVLLINTLDFWLTIAVCELALGTALQLVQLQRYFNNCAHLDASLERELEMLSLVCATSAPQFRLCGLLDLDYSTGLKVLLTVILFVIYLVQVNYEEL